MAASPIPGVDRYLSREEWQPAEHPISGPRQNTGQITHGRAHFTAATRIGDPVAFLRMTQRDYKVNRGYSVGYLYAVDTLGVVYELRGTDFRSAANNGDKPPYDTYNLNPYTAPVLFLVDGHNRLTTDQARSGRAVYRYMQQRTIDAGGKAWISSSALPHSESDNTNCPGNGIRLDIAEGLLDIDYPGDLYVGNLTGDDDMTPIPATIVVDTRRGIGLPDQRPAMLEPDTPIRLPVTYGRHAVELSVDVVQMAHPNGVLYIAPTRDALDNPTLGRAVTWRGEGLYAGAEGTTYPTESGVYVWAKATCRCHLVVAVTAHR